MNPTIQDQLHTTTNSILKDGQRVKVQGTLKSVPSIEVMQNDWQLNADDANYVFGKGMYLEAENVQLVQ